MQQYFFQFQTIPNKLTCLHHVWACTMHMTHGPLLALLVDDLCFTSKGEHVHNSLAMSNNAFFDILNISFHLLSSYSTRKNVSTKWYFLVLPNVKNLWQLTGLSKLMWCIHFVLGITSTFILTRSLHSSGWMQENLGSYLGWKWISVVNPTMIENFQLLILRWPKIFYHSLGN
jgi:hypothetical protein